LRDRLKHTVRLPSCSAVIGIAGTERFW